MSYQPKRKIYKIVILGDGAVGKTSLRHRYLGEGFKRSYMATIGADFAVKKLNSENNAIAQIWDLAGQQRFSVVREGYYLGTKGALLVFDISRQDTFYSLPNWLNELMQNIDETNPPPLVLVGNKADLRDNPGNFITPEQGQEYAEQLSEWAELDVPYIESSAKTGFNVDYVFDSLVKNINLRDGTTIRN